MGLLGVLELFNTFFLPVFASACLSLYVGISFWCPVKCIGINRTAVYVTYSDQLKPSGRTKTPDAADKSGDMNSNERVQLTIAPVAPTPLAEFFCE